MKQLILITILCTTILCGCRVETTEHEKRIEAELHQQQESKTRWQAIAFTLGVGCIGALMAGAAIGSKGRRDANQ